MYQVAPQIRHYPWGSRSVLATLTGRAAPTSKPEAELWVGAHPNASAMLIGAGSAGGLSLEQLIRLYPLQVLGTECVGRFGEQLPFLLKVLAVDGALSIQCHPSTGQVQTAPPGTYSDRWGKPEAVLALTRFEVFAGLHSFRRIQGLLTRLGLPSLTRLADELVGRPQPVRDLLDRLLHLPPTLRHQLIATALEACHRYRGTDQAPAAVLRAALHHPHDIGLVLLLMMRYRVLAPGTFLYLPPGLLHAYLHGAAIEIQANSDNVVRAALTSKPIDLPELLRIVDPAAQPSPRRAAGDGRILSWPLRRQPHFVLHQVAGGQREVVLPGHRSPRVALVLGGASRLRSGDRTMTLQPGECGFLPACGHIVSASGPGTIYLAGVGSSAHVVTRAESTTATPPITRAGR